MILANDATNDYIMLGQIYGTSRILLWNPEQRTNMYPSDLFDIDGSISKINFKNIKKEYNNFNKSKYIEIILNPGQILSIPPYWWYYIDNLNKNIIMQLNIDSYL